MKRAILCICILSAMQFISLQAQDYRIENITSEYVRIDKGLSQNTVNCLLQDREGYIWAGTWNGLNRFDGYSFKTFNINLANPEKGLTNATVVSLAEDTLGNIWAASTTGLNRISKRDFTITRFTENANSQDGMSNDTIHCLFTDRRGDIWIGTNQGVLILDPGTLKFRHIEHNPRDRNTISSNRITSILQDTAGSMWIGTAFGLNKYNPESGKVIRYLADSETGKPPQSHISALCSDKKGNIWIGTLSGLWCYRPSQRSLLEYPVTAVNSGQTGVKMSGISCLFTDRNDILWVGLRDYGLFQYDPGRKKFVNVDAKLSDGGDFGPTTYFCIIQGSNGIYWLGTAHNGLLKMVPDPHSFFEIIRNQSVFGIIEPNPGIFWIGTQEGVMVLNRKNNGREFIKHSPGRPGSLSDNQVTDLLYDPPYVWIGTQNGLNRYHTPSGTNKTFFAGQTGNSPAGNLVWDVFRDSRGIYWFATDKGLSRYDVSTGQFRNFVHNPENPNSLSNNYCLNILELEAGRLLISTSKGLNEYDEKRNLWKVHLPVTGNANTLPAEYVLGSFRDNSGQIWAFTNGGGFCSFDPANGTFERYSTADGLADNVVYGMYEDKDGIIWLPTNNGLSRFDHRNDEFVNFDVQDGLLSNEFNINSIHLTENDEVFLGGVNGVVAFYPQTTVRTSPPPVTRITSFTVHGEQNRFDLPVTDTIRIKSADNTFSISFAAMDFLNPFKNQFSYYLENFDKAKTRLSPGEHQADYKNVPPGHYTFRVAGTNSLGIRGDEAVTTVIVVPAWYQTRTFVVLSVLGSLFVIGLVIFLRVNSLRNKHEMERRLLITRNELIRSQKFALRSQMNPHFIFNSLNSIQNFVLKNDVDSANYYLSNFSTLMRKVLEYSQYNFITLYEELEMIRLYLKMEHMRFSKKFDLNIEVDPGIDQNMVMIPPMLLQPYLENAILHGLQLIRHKGVLDVLIADREDHMVISIVDNGIGREKARAIRERSGHKSRGLANIEKRIQLYNSISKKQLSVNIIDRTDERGEPAGTLVEITVPYEMEEHPQEIL